LVLATLIGRITTRITRTVSTIRTVSSEFTDAEGCTGTTVIADAIAGIRAGIRASRGAIDSVASIASIAGIFAIWIGFWAELITDIIAVITREQTGVIGVSSVLIARLIIASAVVITGFRIFTIRIGVGAEGITHIIVIIAGRFTRIFTLVTVVIPRTVIVPRAVVVPRAIIPSAGVGIIRDTQTVRITDRIDTVALGKTLDTTTGHCVAHR